MGADHDPDRQITPTTLRANITGQKLNLDYAVMVLMQHAA